MNIQWCSSSIHWKATSYVRSNLGWLLSEDHRTTLWPKENVWQGLECDKIEGFHDCKFANDLNVVPQKISKIEERSSIIEMSSIQIGSLFKIENRRRKKFLWEMGFRRSEKISFLGGKPEPYTKIYARGLTQHETRRAWQRKNFEENLRYFCRLRLFCIKVNVETTKRQVKFCRFCNLVLRW